MSNRNGILGLIGGIALFCGISTAATLTNPNGWTVWLLGGPLSGLLLCGIWFIIQDIRAERRWQKESMTSGLNVREGDS